MNNTTSTPEVTPVKKGDCVTIIGRRWFDKVNGNTYFTAIGLINNVEVVSVPFEYGYGEQYVYATFKAMQEAGYMPDVRQHENGSSEPFWSYCERKGLHKLTTVSDVKRKKDL